ncbi:LysR family transcriptional regulator [Sphingomonas ginsenosidivorax]|nr:LysR family transcriptional regulator [Sphingomonas ginsenosidivorax]
MFLAVAQGGTVRAAADRLRLNHATILRGIARLEEALGVKLFDRLPAGYRLTDAGSDIVELAEQMQTASARIEARVFGLDQSVSGKLRFTMPPSFATHLLMPDITRFRTDHPDIGLEIAASGILADLSNREADVALRVVLDASSIPDYLIGSRTHGFHSAWYYHRDFIANDTASQPAWLLREGASIPVTWPSAAGLSASPTPVRFADMRSQFAAARAGMGIARLPCFLGDADPILARVQGCPIERDGEVWLLTHSETRSTRRVRLLRDFLQTALQQHADLLEGRGGNG